MPNKSAPANLYNAQLNYSSIIIILAKKNEL